MNEALESRVAWRRRHTPHHYVGTLAATDVGLRLDGREAATGIELSLSIPFSEIEEVAESNGDRVAGEPAVVLRLAGSEPVLLQGVGPAAPLAADLARTLEGLREQARRPRRVASSAGRRRRQS